MAVRPDLSADGLWSGDWPFCVNVVFDRVAAERLRLIFGCIGCSCTDFYAAAVLHGSWPQVAA